MNDTLVPFFSQKILPAVTFSSENDAIHVADAILKGGLNIMEVAFRNSLAAASIIQIRQSFPEMNIGAGTLISINLLHQAIDAGAQFGLSPGFNRPVVQEARRLNFPFIPGVMTPSDIEQAAEAGSVILKLFPAEQIGGVSFLKAIHAPYEQLNLKFIPMGGVNLQNMNDFLQLTNVIAIGGSWLASMALIREKDYTGIEKNVREAIENLH